MAWRQIKMSKVFTDIQLRWPSLINNDNESPYQQRIIHKDGGGGRAIGSEREQKSGLG